MAELVGGALLGTAFSILYESLKDLIGKNREFGSILKDIQFRLDSFKPVIDQIILHYNEEDRKELEEVFQKGKVLVDKYLGPFSKKDKCLGIRWNLCRKRKYANQLVEWDKSLKRQLDLVELRGIISAQNTEAMTQDIQATVQNTEAVVQDTQATVQNTEAVVQDTHATVQNTEAVAQDTQTTAQNIKAVVQHTHAMIEKMVNGCLKPNQSPEIEACCVVPEPPSLTVGLDEPLKELKRKMFEDGESMIVVSALGGSGKTTLAIHFCRDPQVKEKFKNNIFFVTVSRNLKLELIVQQLYQLKGYKKPDFTDEENSVTWLQKFLRAEGQNPLLLVLDDVWPGSESLLGKFWCKGLKNCKILFTSRSEIPRFGFQYKLQLLNVDDARELFDHSAVPLGTNSRHIPQLSEKIIECCKGLPIAIKVVGGSLWDQPIQIWQDRVIELSKGHSIIASETELSDCLQKSTDALDKKNKKYFLDLGAFPEDKRISVGALIDLWAGLHDLTPENFIRCISDFTGVDSVEHIVCMAMLFKLKSRNLVTLVDTRKDKIDEDGYYNGHYVTQHDLLRALATHLSGLDPVEQRKRLVICIRENDIPKWWRKPKDQPMMARLLSVSTDSAFSTTMPNMLLPQAEVLILNFQTKIYVLPEFVKNIEHLKVLLVRYDGPTLVAELDHFELLGSLLNLKRIRLESISICSITKNPIKLESLWKMSFFMCDFSQAFSNSSIKISDAFPKLEEMNIDDCYYLEEFLAECCDLVHLTKLSITKCRLVSLPEGIGSLVKLEVLRLRSCTALSMIPDSVRKLINLKFLDISDCSSIYKLPEFMGEMRSLRNLDMRHCSYMELPESVLDLKKLEKVICSYRAKELWEAVKPSLGSICIVAVPLNWSDFYN